MHMLLNQAEDTLVTIIPKFSRRDPYRFIGGTYGPFIPNLPVKVPLWLALHLKKNQKCQIQAPLWLDPGTSINVFIL